ncbi:unnamed protein product [Toxocara canis]|uniref:Transposase n=1 Tax=Toxocara canis TaxID=6265 RepID=A0A183UC74_TOXCA|nr:unnamed protein product [Toxocara canis]
MNEIGWGYDRTQLQYGLSTGCAGLGRQLAVLRRTMCHWLVAVEWHMLPALNRKGFAITAQVLLGWPVGQGPAGRPTVL